MGQDDSEGGGMGFLARLLIILFGVGIVALGLHPIRAKYGSLSKFLQKETTAFAGDGSVSGEALKRLRAVSDAFSAATTERELERPKDGGVESAESKKKPKVDQISDGDRRQLSDLVNKLGSR